MIYNVIGGAICGGLSALFAEPIVRFFKLNRMARFVLVVIFFGINITIAKMYVYPRIELVQLKNEYPLFATIAKTDPADYEIFTTNVELDSQRQGQITREIFEKNSRELISKVFPKYLVKASDENIYNYLSDLVKTYRDLYEINPKIIIALESGGNFSSELSVPQEKLVQLMDIKLLLIQNSFKDGESFPSQDVAMAALKPVLADLVKKYGVNTLTLFLQGKINTLSSSDSASFLIDFYQGILNSGVASSGIIIRYLTSSAIQK